MSEPVNENGQTLSQFLKSYDPDKYEHPSVTVDVVLITYEGDVLLIQRKNHPSIGHWAVPGGFVDMTEALDTAAKRELFEETGLEDVALTPLGMYGEPSRDPRTRIFTCAFLARAHRDQLSFHAGDDAADASLFSIHVSEPVKALLPDSQLRKHMISLPATATGTPLSSGCSEYEITLKSLSSPRNILGVRCGIDENGTNVLLGGMHGKGVVAGDHGLIIFEALRRCRMLPVSFDELVSTARSLLNPREVSSSCYAGSVAAALLTEGGRVYTGVSIDTACSVGFCAEHGAISQMVAAGESRIVKLAAVNSEGPIAPCGRCREFIYQLNPENKQCQVLLADRIVTIDELLPYRD